MLKSEKINPVARDASAWEWSHSQVMWWSRWGNGLFQWSSHLSCHLNEVGTIIKEMGRRFSPPTYFYKRDEEYEAWFSLFLLPGGWAENPGGAIKILKRIRLADFACAECETESEKTWGVLKLKPKLCPSAPWPTTISKYCIRSNVDIPRRPQTLVILLMVANERLGGVGAP